MFHHTQSFGLCVVNNTSLQYRRFINTEHGYHMGRLLRILEKKFNESCIMNHTSA